VKSIVASPAVKDTFYQQLHQQLDEVANANLLLLKDLHNAETRFYCPETFLSLDLHVS